MTKGDPVGSPFDTNNGFESLKRRQTAIIIQALNPQFGGIQQLLTVPGQQTAFFIHLHRLIQRQIARFELRHQIV